MRISDWSSDVCSSDLRRARKRHVGVGGLVGIAHPEPAYGFGEGVFEGGRHSFLGDKVGDFVCGAEGLCKLRHENLLEKEVSFPARALSDGVKDRAQPDREAAMGVTIFFGGHRSEARRVGKECVSTCRSRWSPDH